MTATKCKTQASRNKNIKIQNNCYCVAAWALPVVLETTIRGQPWVQYKNMRNVIATYAESIGNLRSIILTN